MLIIGIVIGNALLVIGLMYNMIWQYKIMRQIFIQCIFYYEPTTTIIIIGLIIVLLCLLKLYNIKKDFK